MTFLRSLLDDLVKLKLPVTAAAVLATVLALAEPFGISLGGDTTAKVTAALVAFGVIAAYVQSKLGGIVVKTNPATLSSTPEAIGRMVGEGFAAGVAAPRPGERGNPE